MSWRKTWYLMPMLPLSLRHTANHAGGATLHTGRGASKKRCSICALQGKAPGLLGVKQAAAHCLELHLVILMSSVSSVSNTRPQAYAMYCVHGMGKVVSKLAALAQTKAGPRLKLFLKQSPTCALRCSAIYFIPSCARALKCPAMIPL